MRTGRLLSEQALRRARAPRRPRLTPGRLRSSTVVDVVLAPTTAQPPPPVHAFDKLGGTATDRAMIAACPVTWPWNVLGWPSINVPAGFTSDGLPIGVQLMGPANSEPLLVSLAAELEAVSGWATKQPGVWWKPSRRDGRSTALRRNDRHAVDRCTGDFAVVRCWPRRVAAAVIAGMPTASADNRLLNDGVVANVYTIQHQARLSITDVKINPKLRLAAQWHTNDVLNNRALDGDIGSDGSTVADRARNAAGYAASVAETVAINPALAINGIEIMNQWYYRPDYHAIMSDCSNVDIGVWSENMLLDRSVVVAVYGKGDGARGAAPSAAVRPGPGWTPVPNR